jgi:hypothetical protein
MYKLNLFQFRHEYRTLRQLAQPVEIPGGEMLPGPKGRQSSHGIEVFQIHDACDGFVVVAPHNLPVLGPHAVNHRIGIGSIADYIAEVDDVIVGRNRVQASVERFEVRVNITEQQNAQAVIPRGNWWIIDLFAGENTIACTREGNA